MDLFKLKLSHIFSWMQNFYSSDLSLDGEFENVFNVFHSLLFNHGDIVQQFDIDCHFVKKKIEFMKEN